MDIEKNLKAALSLAHSAIEKLEKENAELKDDRALYVRIQEDDQDTVKDLMDQVVKLQNKNAELKEKINQVVNIIKGD
jgi:Mg2+ and Co2+ transporter CorA